jgi:hypothetical protein
MFLVGQEGNGPTRPTMHGKDSKGRYTYCICGSVKHRLAVRVSSLLMGQPIVAQALLVLSLLSSQILLPF